MSQTVRTSSSTFGSIPVGSSVTEKRTVITTSSGSQNEEPGGLTGGDFYYRSSISPRNTNIQRTSTSSMGPLSPGTSRISRTVEISSGYTAPGMANIANSGAVAGFKTSREREKQDMRDLNERFANYIEKVRFLEAQNRKLASELEDLRSKWGKETNAVKTMYETELEEARKVIEETNKDRSRLQVRVGQLEEQMDDIQRQMDDAKKWRSQDRETINKLNQQISELEAEIRMLRRTNDSLDTERQRDKQAINRLNEELEKLRMDLSNETIQRLDAENRAQTLAEELEFLKSVHEQELKELAALAYRDTTAENREFWKNELSQAIRDIQNEYDSKMDTIRGEMETFYNLKVQEFRTGATKQNMEVTHAREETKKVQKIMNDCKIRMADLEARNAQIEKQYQDLMREMEQKEQDHALEVNQLKDEMNKLRAEMESMLVELQTLMDAKLSLELEIAAYRKLLETEESRTGLTPRRQPRSVSKPEVPVTTPEVAQPTSASKHATSGEELPSEHAPKCSPEQSEETVSTVESDKGDEREGGEGKCEIDRSQIRHFVDNIVDSAKVKEGIQERSKEMEEMSKDGLVEEKKDVLVPEKEGTKEKNREGGQSSENEITEKDRVEKLPSEKKGLNDGETGQELTHVSESTEGSREKTAADATQENVQITSQEKETRNTQLTQMDESEKAEQDREITVSSTNNKTEDGEKTHKEVTNASSQESDKVDTQVENKLAIPAKNVESSKQVTDSKSEDIPEPLKEQPVSREENRPKVESVESEEHKLSLKSRTEETNQVSQPAMEPAPSLRYEIVEEKNESPQPAQTKDTGEPGKEGVDQKIQTEKELGSAGISSAKEKDLDTGQALRPEPEPASAKTTDPHKLNAQESHVEQIAGSAIPKEETKQNTAVVEKKSTDEKPQQYKDEQSAGNTDKVNETLAASTDLKMNISETPENSTMFDTPKTVDTETHENAKENLTESVSDKSMESSRTTEEQTSKPVDKVKDTTKTNKEDPERNSGKLDKITQPDSVTKKEMGTEAEVKDTTLPATVDEDLEKTDKTTTDTGKAQQDKADLKIERSDHDTKESTSPTVKENGREVESQKTSKEHVQEDANADDTKTAVEKVSDHHTMKSKEVGPKEEISDESLKGKDTTDIEKTVNGKHTVHTEETQSVKKTGNGEAKVQVTASDNKKESEGVTEEETKKESPAQDKETTKKEGKDGISTQHFVNGEATIDKGLNQKEGQECSETDSSHRKEINTGDSGEMTLDTISPGDKTKDQQNLKDKENNAGNTLTTEPTKTDTEVDQRLIEECGLHLQEQILAKERDIPTGDKREPNDEAVEAVVKAMKTVSKEALDSHTEPQRTETLREATERSTTAGEELLMSDKTADSHTKKTTQPSETDKDNLNNEASIKSSTKVTEDTSKHTKFADNTGEHAKPDARDRKEETDKLPTALQVNGHSDHEQKEVHLDEKKTLTEVDAKATNIKEAEDIQDTYTTSTSAKHGNQLVDQTQDQNQEKREVNSSNEQETKEDAQPNKPQVQDSRTDSAPQQMKQAGKEESQQDVRQKDNVTNHLQEPEKEAEQEKGDPAKEGKHDTRKEEKIQKPEIAQESEKKDGDKDAASSIENAANQVTEMAKTEPEASEKHRDSSRSKENGEELKATAPEVIDSHKDSTQKAEHTAGKLSEDLGENLKTDKNDKNEGMKEDKVTENKDSTMTREQLQEDVKEVIEEIIQPTIVKKRPLHTQEQNRQQGATEKDLGEKVESEPRKTEDTNDVRTGENVEATQACQDNQREVTQEFKTQTRSSEEACEGTQAFKAKDEKPEIIKEISTSESQQTSNDKDQADEENINIDDDIVETKFDFKQYESGKKAETSSLNSKTPSSATTHDSEHKPPEQLTKVQSSPASQTKMPDDSSKTTNGTSLQEEKKSKEAVEGSAKPAAQSRPATDSSLQMKMMRGEVSAKTTYQRTANGPVAIAETHPEGRFIVLENNPSSGVRKDVNIGNWTLQRQLDNKRTITYKFPSGAAIKYGKTMKIWAGGFSTEQRSGDLVFSEQNDWGTGAQVVTTLLNEKNEEKASHIQKTLYS